MILDLSSVQDLEGRCNRNRLQFYGLESYEGKGNQLAFVQDGWMTRPRDGSSQVLVIMIHLPLSLHSTGIDLRESLCHWRTGSTRVTSCVGMRSFVAVWNFGDYRYKKERMYLSHTWFEIRQGFWWWITRPLPPFLKINSGHEPTPTLSHDPQSCQETSLHVFKVISSSILTARGKTFWIKFYQNTLVRRGTVCLVSACLMVLLYHFRFESYPSGGKIRNGVLMQSGIRWLLREAAPSWRMRDLIWICFFGMHITLPIQALTCAMFTSNTKNPVDFSECGRVFRKSFRMSVRFCAVGDWGGHLWKRLFFNFKCCVFEHQLSFAVQRSRCCCWWSC